MEELILFGECWKRTSTLEEYNKYLDIYESEIYQNFRLIIIFDIRKGSDNQFEFEITNDADEYAFGFYRNVESGLRDMEKQLIAKGSSLVPAHYTILT